MVSIIGNFRTEKKPILFTEGKVQVDNAISKLQMKTTIKWQVSRKIL